MPLKEIVERLGGTTDGKTYTLHGAETAVRRGTEWRAVRCVSYLWGQSYSADTVGQSRNRVIITEAPDEIPPTHGGCSGGTKPCADCVLRQRSTVPRSVRLMDARDETMVDLLRVTSKTES